MLFLRKGAASLALFMIWAGSLSAQTSLNRIIPSGEGTVEQYYELDEAALLAPEFIPGTHFTFEMTPNAGTEFILTKKRSYIPGTISFIAREKDGQGQSLSFTYSEGRIHGLFHKSHQETLTLKYDPEKRQNYVVEASETGNNKLACGLHENPEKYDPPILGQSTHSGQRAKGTSAYSYSPAPLYASEDDSVTIDVMIVYTNAAETWANSSNYGNIDAVIAQSFNVSQTALDNSLSGIEIRLVHAYKTTYDEETDEVESDVRLRRLTQNPNNPVFNSTTEYDGYMEDIHPLRDQYGADVVAMFALINDTGGLGWRLGSTGGDPAFAFNVNRVQQIADSYTLIHEIGHNMGNAHSRTQNDSPANDGGGLFHFSAGYQDNTNNFHTIMAYADGLNEAPLFSSPNLTWQGNPAGTDNLQRPVDNAQSMKIIKRTVASYRPTEVESPSAALSTGSITVEMNREDNLSVPLDITNSGASGLIWSADFDFTSQTVAKKNKTGAVRQDIKAAVIEDQTRLPANYSGLENRGKAKLAETILYDTSFETGDGFFNGTYTGRADWHSLNSGEFSISNSNPNSGAQHLRVSQGGSGTKFIASPFFGYQLFGSYEVTLSFAVSDISETYDINIKDGKTGNNSAYIIIAQETIFVAEKGETGELDFFGTNATVTPNVYRTLRIVYNVANETIDYYYGGSLIAQNGYLYGFTPGVLQVIHRNQVNGASIDVDDLQVKRISAPYEWLDVPEMTGVALEQETKPITLNFNTSGISAGNYETLLTVQTNDPANPKFEVPITLTVNDVVPNEAEDRPVNISLDQNYPNPFNPSTTISYTLNAPQEVQLDVYNIQGRKVATLQKGRVGAGSHSISFDARNLSSGVYVYRLKTAEQTLTRQMVLIK